MVSDRSRVTIGRLPFIRDRSPLAEVSAGSVVSTFRPQLGASHGQNIKAISQVLPLPHVTASDELKDLGHTIRPDRS